MSGLPQELIDHVIDHVHDSNTLEACSLVCSQWSARSRKHLFVRVVFTSEEDLQRWCARIRPGPSGLSSLVEDLTLIGYHLLYMLPSQPWIHPPILSNAAPHFQSFSRLRVLEVWRWDMSTDRVLSMLHSFGSSLENVTCLRLMYDVVSPPALAMFISHFPRLNDLSIDYPKGPDSGRDLYRGFHVDIVPTHPRGEFRALGFSQLPIEVFEDITLLEPRFRRVSLEPVNYDAWRDYWSLVEACAGSLEELHIRTTTTGTDCDGLSLACCPNLRKIALSLGHGQLVRPCHFVEKCLSTITSTQLSEVSLSLLRDTPDFRPPGLNLVLWDPLDIILHNLAGKYRPRYEGDKMVVELEDVSPDLSEAENFLWRYRERGILRANSAA